MPNYTNDIYNIEKAFRAIEDELISSMIRNMKHHRAWENDEGFQWSQWQVDQLKALEKYKADNRKKFSSQFSNINNQIGVIIAEAREQGGMDQEIEILMAIKRGYRVHGNNRTASTRNIKQTGEFFKLNTKRLDALIKATKHDFDKAEHAMLRMADDQYRKIIFNAQMYANSGAGTYAKAVDMATKDFLSRGINCIEYKNGARHTMQDYASMCLRTSTKRAYLVGEGEKRQEWGIHLVTLNRRSNACPLCSPFVGKILVDDVWSGGNKKDGNYTLMSYAIEAGLYHPNCKDIHTTYFKDLDEIDKKYNFEEKQSLIEDYKQEQKQKYVTRLVNKYDRLSNYSLDDENINTYKVKADQWKTELKTIVKDRKGDID